MQATLILIPGLGLDSRCWADWATYFQCRGHRVLAPDWPGAAPGALALETVVEHFARIAGEEELAPVLAGHDVGGLVVQRLLAAGHGEAGICLASVPPAELLREAAGRFRGLAEPAVDAEGAGAEEGASGARRDAGWAPTREEFWRDWAGAGWPRPDAERFYAEYVTPGSRRVASDCLGAAGVVDLERPHAPLLIVGAEGDRVVPDAICEANARAYLDPGSVADYRLFPGRGHLLPFEPGWEEVAGQVDGWLSAHVGRELAERG